MLLLPSGYGYGSFAALLLLFLIPWGRGVIKQRLTFYDWMVITTFASYALISFVSVCLYDINPSIRNFDAPSRTLIGIAIFWLALQIRPSFYAIVYGISCGAVGAGLLACYQKFILGQERALSNFTFVIEAGDISMAMGIMSLAFAFYFYRKQSYYLFAFCIVATLMGVFGSLLSGSRGGWICSPFIILGYLWHSRQALSKRLRFLAIGIMIAFAGIMLMPKVGVVERLEQAKSDLIHYYDGTNLNTSLGIRFQLWQSSWYSFLEKPLFGWGQNGVMVSKEKQQQQGLITPFIEHFDSHAHNEYLDEMAKRGIIGLLMLLANFIVPLFLFKKIAGKMAEDTRQHCIAMAGCFLVLNAMDFCLTQAFYQHVAGVMFYFPLLGILLGYCLPRLQKVPI